MTGMCKRSRIKFQRIQKTLKTNVALIVKDDVKKCSEKNRIYLWTTFPTRQPCFMFYSKASVRATNYGTTSRERNKDKQTNKDEKRKKKLENKCILRQKYIVILLTKY